MRFVVLLSSALLTIAPAMAVTDCHELPRSGPLIVGKADNELFIAGPEDAAGLCAVFPKSGDPARFLAKGSYRLLPGSRVIDWTGAWSQGAHARITIAIEDDVMIVEGEASHGLDRSSPALAGFDIEMSRPEEWTEEVAFAVIDDTAAPIAEAEPFECTIRLRRAGLWLVVNDNGRCGGEGVSFGGIYEREPSR